MLRAIRGPLGPASRSIISQNVVTRNSGRLAPRFGAPCGRTFGNSGFAQQRYRDRIPPSNRTKYAHSSNQKDWTSVGGLVRPVLFASTVTLGVFGLAAVQTERDKLEKVKEEARRREAEKNEGWTSFLKSAFGGSESGSFPARREAPDGFLQRLEIMLGTSVSELSPPMKVITGIVALNGLVFLAWQIPRLQPIMARRFMHWAPDGGRGGTMLTSAFSHMSLPHLAFNMIGLYSFGSLLAEGVFSRDPHRPGFPMSRPDFNAAAWEFTAFYLSGCVLSSLSSQLNNVRMFAGTIGRAVAPSLGASGGVYGIVAASAILFPWTSVNVFMVPIALRLGTVFPVMLAGDLAGMLLRWQTFDHAAHLGGALWGAWYIYYGREVYDKLREKVRAQLWKNEQLKR